MQAVQNATASKYWRMRCRNDRDYSKDAWNREEVGIWYGAWSAGDWYAATQGAASPQHQCGYLKALPHQTALGWNPALSKASFDTARRFANIADDDWVVVYFDGCLHVGHVIGPLESDIQHPLNCSPEILKYRRVHSRKSFSLALLPDEYRLIPAAGRGNVHEYWDTNRFLVKLMAEFSSEQEVTREIRKLSPKEWLDVIGPTGWESLSLGFLILQEQFVPTGLKVGGTLPIFDIVGRAPNGDRIVAQCKKTPYRVACDLDFLEAVSDLGAAVRAYFFAYRGCTNAPNGVTVITGDDILSWWQGPDPKGQMHGRLFRGTP